MDKSDLRKESRLALARRATLTFAGKSSPCLIQDFSAKGFLIMSTKQFSVGNILELNLELYPGQLLACKIEVRHNTDNCLGTMIVEMSESQSRLCGQFVDEHYADRLKFG